MFDIFRKMEEEFGLKKKILKKNIINITKDDNFFNIKKKESWESYLERILKAKKPECLYESFVYVYILCDNFDLNTEDKLKALKILGFNKRS